MQVMTKVTNRINEGECVIFYTQKVESHLHCDVLFLAFVKRYNLETEVL